MNLKNITEKDIKLQEGNMGGLIGGVYIIERDDIDTFGIPNLNSDDPVTLTWLTLKEGKAFKKVYFTPNTGKYDAKIVGEEDGKSLEPMVEFSIPKLSKLAQEMLSFVANGSFIVVVKTSNNQLIVIGTPEIPAKYKDGGIETGAKYADKNQVKFGFVASSRFGAYFLPDGFDIDLLVLSNIANIVFDNPVLDVNTANSTLLLTLGWVDNTLETPYSTAEDKIQLNVSYKNVTYEFKNLSKRENGEAEITLYGISPGDEVVFEWWVTNKNGNSTKSRLTKTVI